jgi:hypothetical protein
VAVVTTLAVVADEAGGGGHVQLAQRPCEWPRIGVWGPIFCCSSLSSPTSSSFFDSLEPFCTSQIVAAMKSEN